MTDQTKKKIKCDNCKKEIIDEGFIHRGCFIFCKQCEQPTGKIIIKGGQNDL